MLPPKLSPKDVENLQDLQMTQAALDTSLLSPESLYKKGNHQQILFKKVMPKKVHNPVSEKWTTYAPSASL